MARSVLIFGVVLSSPRVSCQDEPQSRCEAGALCSWTNGDLGWEVSCLDECCMSGFAMGLDWATEDKLEDLFRQEGPQLLPQLYRSLDDPDRWAVAHVALTLVRASFRTGTATRQGQDWNYEGLTLRLEDASYQVRPASWQTVREQWRAQPPVVWPEGSINVRP